MKKAKWKKRDRNRILSFVLVLLMMVTLLPSGTSIARASSDFAQKVLPAPGQEQLFAEGKIPQVDAESDEKESGTLADVEGDKKETDTPTDVDANQEELFTLMDVTMNTDEPINTAEIISTDEVRLETVYLNGTSGDDANDGSSKANAVKTMRQAYELVEDYGTIIICGDTYFDENSAGGHKNYIAPAIPVTFEAINGAELKIWASFVLLQADTTFQNITLKNQLSNAALVANGHTLKFGKNFELVEINSRGSGLRISGGAYCGYPDATLNIAGGSNIIIQSGTFNNIHAGPDSYGDSGCLTDPVIYTGTYKVHVTGNGKVSNLYAGCYWEMARISELTLPKSEITVNSNEVEVENIWGGGYWLAPVSQNPQITQEKTTINIDAGTVDCIFGGSFSGLYTQGGSYTIDEVALNIGGNPTINEIYSGGVIAGTENDSNYSVLDRLEKITLKTAIDLSNTTIYSNGDSLDVGYGLPSVNEKAETGTVEIILTGDGKISGLLVCEEEDGEHTAADAEKQILTLDNGSFSILSGFDELKLQNGGKAILDRDISFDQLLSDNNSKNRLIYQKDISGNDYPILTFNSRPALNNPVLLEFIDYTQENVMPVGGQVLMAFPDEDMAETSQFSLAAALLHEGFYLGRDGAKLVIGFIDFTVLDAALKDAKEIAQGTHTAETWTALQTAIAEGETVRNSSGAEITAAEMASAAQKIREAITGLKTQSGSSSSGGSSKSHYTVTFNTNGGSTVSSQSVNINAKATKPVNPTKDGSTFAGWFTDKALTQAYNFDSAVKGSLTLYAKWTEKEDISGGPTAADKWANPFTDVKESDWYYGDVEHVYTKGLFKGVTENTFGPNVPMTRAMLVTALWRQAGSPDERIPAAAGGGQFTDVATDAYYYQAVNWAAAKSLVMGIGDNLFAPDAKVTREQMAAILMRYLTFTEAKYTLTDEEQVFADEKQISPYAKDALRVLHKLGILTGKGNNLVDPQGNATRAEVAAMLHRLSEVVK